MAVEIAGQRYVIKTDADDTYITELARYVDRKIVEAKRLSRTVSTHQVVILAGWTPPFPVREQAQNGAA